MIGYVTIGYNDIEKAGAFYDALFGALGVTRDFADQGWIGYGGQEGDTVKVYLCPPHDKNPATFGNGSMLAFKAKDKAEVAAAHEAGLRAGGSDEGAPGPRPADSTTYYGAYLRDPAGNKLCVYCRP